MVEGGGDCVSVMCGAWLAVWKERKKKCAGSSLTTDSKQHFHASPPPLHDKHKSQATHEGAADDGHL